MTDTMSARERIHNEVAQIMFGNEWKLVADPDIAATDRIIDIVREALLSDDAVDANGEGWLEKSMEYWSSNGKYNESEKATEAFRNGLSLALDAAFGDQQS